MLNPPHLGEVIRESMNEVGWNVTQTAARLGCERGTLSRLLGGKAGVSVNLALALEAVGWGTADHWMRMRPSYDRAEARRADGWREDIRVGDAVPRGSAVYLERHLPAPRLAGHLAG
ncbi:MAG: HigA family addiction module antidote protein [Gemmatimonadetes bacterium]|nr:HigA family addiction module antidote protein [Gemmatimonadota bacterium]